MTNYCLANCDECNNKDTCKGCNDSSSSPFGGKCLAKEYIKIGGQKYYQEFKKKLINEINEHLSSLDLPLVDNLFELKGEFVNLDYSLPNGEKVRFLNDNDIYLGNQIEFADLGICYGIVANNDFILICSYSVNGTEPELILFKKR